MVTIRKSLTRRERSAFLELAPEIHPADDGISLVLAHRAIHEAGHAVAGFFVGLGAGFVKASMLGDGRPNAAYVRWDGRAYFAAFGAGPVSALAARQHLLTTLAGIAAQQREDEGSEADHRELIFTYGFDVTDGDLATAHVLAGRLRWPPSRTLETFARYAVEAFQLPEVWTATQRMAETLLERGEVKPGRLLDSIVRDVSGAGLRLPQWRRRIARR